MLLQGVQAVQRDGMITSMVYEASARVKDPVNGCTTEVRQLHEKIAKLELELVSKEAELKNMQDQYDNLTLPLGTRSLDAQLVVHPKNIIYEEVDHLQSWWPLWEA
ncbi:hypothetical protein SUGI_0307320 [Cryptomeria japonica]|nr:hypothetical protein SUGI_0307320 [Cryptomeria japonica]